MIEITMTGMCEGCKYAELELDCYHACNENYWSIRCRHEYACNYMETKTITRLGKQYALEYMTKEGTEK